MIRRTPIKSKPPKWMREEKKHIDTSDLPFSKSMGVKIIEEKPKERRTYKPPKRTPIKKNVAEKPKKAYSGPKGRVSHDKLESIFTKDMKTCIITGSTTDVHLHHIFDGPDKAASEKYHFIVPLRGDWHNLADYGIHFNRELDVKYKMLCEAYWQDVLHKTKEEWVSVFRKWWTIDDVKKSA